MTLQREYGETLWANAKSAFEIQNELVKATFEETRDAFKVAMTADQVVVEEAPVPAKKAKAKAKPKAKKTAEQTTEA